MTRMLEQALGRLQQLPEREQDAVASWILEEIESEAEWSRAFASNPDALARKAAEALQEHLSGRTRPLDLSRDL